MYDLKFVDVSSTGVVQGNLIFSTQSSESPKVDTLKKLLDSHGFCWNG